jgi:alpha-N-arabinofuranosidase
MNPVWKTAALVGAVLALAAAACAKADPLVIDARVSVDAVHAGPRIDRHIFGQFAEHLGHGVYDGVWVGEASPIPNTRGYRNDVVAALKALHIPDIRWPGGCFADHYHWRDGVGPRAQRPITLNANWGGVEEPNSFGTHEFFGLLDLVGAEAYLSANVGSGSPREMAAWLEYMTSASHSSLADERRRNGRDKPWPIAILGVGNESWGCGGGMRPEYYADEFRRFAIYAPSGPGGAPIRVASGANGDDYNWTKVLMVQAGGLMDALSLHDYTLPSGDWAKKGAATGFSETEWATTLKGAEHMDELIAKHSAIMDRYDPAKRVALAVDEWGTWYDPEPGSNSAFLQQQNSLRDALVAAVSLNIFQRHADRVRMANIAQMVNVLQAMILTDGPKMVVTPTYDVFKMYVPFQDATALNTTVASPDYRQGKVAMPAVDAVAARGRDGLIYLALVNLDPHRSSKVRATLAGAESRGARGKVLTAAAMDAHNSFERPDAVQIRPYAAHWGAGEPVFDLPPMSVVVVALQP